MKKIKRKIKAEREKLFAVMDKQFGLYLDCISGFKLNLSRIEEAQKKGRLMLGLSIEKLDRRLCILSDKPPSADPDKCKELEKHRRTQGQYKKDNSPGGQNYKFALHNYLCSVFNECKTFKIGIMGKDNRRVVPVLAYLGKIRDRLTHPHAKSTSMTWAIEEYALTHVPDYKLPGFKAGQSIELSENDLDAIRAEIRETIENFED